MQMASNLAQVILVLSCLVILALAHNKYTKEANEDIFAKERPFRMQKLNIIWEKAKTVKLTCKIWKSF